MIENAGQRGIAALLKETAKGLVFVEQSRGIAFEDEGKIRPNPNALDLNINVSCTTGLQYCPSCGCKLQKLVETSPGVFQKLAQEHKKFLARDEF